MYLRKVIKLGGSFLISIPKPIVNSFQLQKGQYLVFSIDEKGQVSLSRVNMKLHKDLFIPGVGVIKHYGKK